MFNIMAWHDRQKGFKRFLTMTFILLPSVVLMILPKTFYIGVGGLCFFVLFRLFYLLRCSSAKEYSEILQKLMEKDVLTDKDSGDLNVLIGCVKIEQSKKIFMETNCEDYKIPIRVCDCKKCNTLKSKFGVV